MSALRELLEKAERDINTYKHPNIAEAQVWLHNILVSAGLPGISHNTIEFISIDDTEISVTSEWSVRGCEDSDTYVFPTFIIDAEDPIKAARKWGLEMKVAVAREELKTLRAQLDGRATRVAKLEAELKELS